MDLTLGQAARHLGVTKPTVSKAISSGKLSATRREDGSFAIDASELERYRSANGHRFPGNRKDAAESLRLEPSPNHASETAALQAEIDGLKAQLATMRELADVWQRQAETWQRQAERLLTDQRPIVPPAPAGHAHAHNIRDPAPRRRGLFGWLVG